MLENIRNPEILVALQFEDFSSFLAVGDRRNYDSYLIYALFIVPSTKSNLLFSLVLISPVNEFLTNTYTLHEMFR